MKENQKIALLNFNKFTSENDDDLIKANYELIYKRYLTKNKTNQNSKVNRVFYFLIHSFLLLRSIVTLVSINLSFKKFNIAHYLIDIDNNSKNYDKRSEHILEIVKPRTTINFFHCSNIFYSLKNSFKVSNPIYFESVLYFFSLRIPKAIEDDDAAFLTFIKNKSKREINILGFLLTLMKISKFLFIDDARHTGILRLLCEAKGIETTAYQHATIEEFHVGLKGKTFDNYLVWNKFFKIYLKEINSDYEKKQILICGHPRIKPNSIKISSKLNNIIFLEESNFDFHASLPYMKIIPDEYNLIFRKKPGLISNTPSIEGLSVTFSSGSSLEEDLQKFKPLLLIGHESTVLLEALLFSIPSLSVGNPKSSNSVIIKKSLVKNCKDLKSFENYLNHYLKMTDSQIEDLRIKFWEKSSKTDYKSSLVNLFY